MNQAWLYFAELVLGALIGTRVYRYFKARRLRRQQPREVCCVPYQVGDQMLRAGEGWRLAREEDGNRVLGMVWLERPAPRPTP